MSTKPETKGDWLVSWDTEDESKWDKKLAWNTLTVTTVSLTLCFVAWFLPSAIIPKLNAIGYNFTAGQLYWLAATPGLSAGLRAAILAETGLTASAGISSIKRFERNSRFLIVNLHSSFPGVLPYTSL